MLQWEFDTNVKKLPAITLLNKNNLKLNLIKNKFWIEGAIYVSYFTQHHKIVKHICCIHYIILVLKETINVYSEILFFRFIIRYCCEIILWKSRFIVL